MARFLDVQHPFFKPLWRRLVTVAACLGWALLELSWGGPMWALLFGLIGLYCAYQFFVAFDPKEAETKEEDS